MFSSSAQETEIHVLDKRFGAKGNGIIDDGDAIQTAINYASSIGGATVILEGKYLVNRTLTLLTNVWVKAKRAIIKSNSTNPLFNIPSNSKNIIISGLTFDYEEANSNIAILVNENVTSFELSRLKFRNFKNNNPNVQQNVLRLKTGISGNISNISFKNIKSIGNGKIMDGGGAGSCIRTDSSGVIDLRNYNLQIDTIDLEDCYNVDKDGNIIIEDFDPIQFQHYSDVSGLINLTNVRAKNFSKRLIKIQGDGVNISNVIAESDTYVPWLIASMAKDCNISNITAKGNIKTSIDFLNSSYVNVNNIHIKSTYIGTNVTDNLFNFYNSSNINITNVTGKGYGGFLFYGNVTENIYINNIDLEVAAQFLFMQNRNAENTEYIDSKIGNIRFGNITAKIPLTSYKTALFAIEGLKNINPISGISFRDLKIIANQAYPYGLLRIRDTKDVYFDNLNIENNSILKNPTLITLEGDTAIEFRKLLIKGTPTSREIVQGDKTELVLARSKINNVHLNGPNTKLELEKTPAIVSYALSATSSQTIIS